MKKFIFAVCLLAANNALADWTESTSINWLRAYPGATNSHYVQIANKKVHMNCDKTQNEGILYLNDETGRVYSAILAAVMAGKQLKFSLGTCTNNGYAEIREIQIPG